MEHVFNEAQPIYRQLMSEIVDWILAGEIDDGDPLPSIRTIATRFRVNPLTALKAFQGLIMSGVVDKQRGVGHFVRRGARKMLLRGEKDKFLQEEVRALVKRMKLLGVTRAELLGALDAERR